MLIIISKAQKQAQRSRVNYKPLMKSTKVQTLGTLDIDTVSHWGIYMYIHVASSYLCYIIHLLGQLQRQAWMHEMPPAAVDTDQQSLAQLSATQQRPTSEKKPAGPCVVSRALCWSDRSTTQYAHAITLVTYVQRKITTWTLRARKIARWTNGGHYRGKQEAL